MRREREARGISLQEVSRETRIGVRLLKAIEQGRYDQLPGGIFNKSFVRQYARYLELDEEITVGAYLQAVGVAREPSLPKFSPSESSGSSSLPSYPRIILTAALLGALCVGVVYGIHEFNQRVNSPDPSVSTVSSEPLQGSEGAPAEAAKLAGGTPGVVTEPTHGSLEPTAEEVAGAPGREAAETVGVNSPAGEGLRLRIAAHGPAWLSITADGEKQWQGTLRANESRQVKAAESLRVTIGDAGAVELTLNDRPLAPLGRSGEVKTLTFTARGATEAPSQ